MAARWGTTTRALFCAPPQSRLHPALWQEIGETLRRQIMQRTRSGIDPRTMRLFPGYSRSYRLRRGHAGLQAGHVDHVWSGTMLNSIAVLPGQNQVKLRLTGIQARKARAHASLHKRPWFALSPADLARAAAALGRALLQAE